MRRYPVVRVNPAGVEPARQRMSRAKEENPPLCGSLTRELRRSNLSRVVHSSISNHTQFMMAAEIFATYIPQLTMAFSAYGVQEIADECLREQLISENTYKRILDPESVKNESNIKKSEILLDALQTCVKRDASCFESLRLKILKPLGGQNKLVREIEEQLKVTMHMPPCKRHKVDESQNECAMETEPLDELFTDAQVQEIKVIQNFTPKLVTAISTCSVLAVSDRFLANGLISDGMYKRLLESPVPSDNKVRILLIAIKDAIHACNSCFEISMSILEKFPLCSDQVQAIRKKYQTFNSQSSPHATGNDQARLFTVIPEIRVIQKFTPELVSAISTCPPDSLYQISA